MVSFVYIFFWIGLHASGQTATAPVDQEPDKTATPETTPLTESLTIPSNDRCNLLCRVAAEQAIASVEKSVPISNSIHAEKMNSAVEGAGHVSFNDKIHAAADAIKDSNPELAAAMHRYANEDRIDIVGLKKTLSENGVIVNNERRHVGGSLFLAKGELHHGGTVGLSKLFNKAEVENRHGIVEVNDPELKYAGRGNGPDPHINRAGITESFATLKATLLPSTGPWKTVTEEDYLRGVVANEQAHELANRARGLAMNDKRDWSTVDSGSQNSTIDDTLQAHEFISDAASINENFGDIARVLGNAMISVKRDDAGNFVSDVGEGVEGSYDYTDTFMIDTIREVLTEAGADSSVVDKRITKLLADIDDTLSSVSSAHPTDLAREAAKELLSTLGKNEIEAIQSAYAEQGNVLLKSI